MSTLSKIGALALFEKLSIITSNQEKIMASIASIEELRAAHAALTTKVSELGTTLTKTLETVSADVAFLRDKIAAGTITQADVDVAKNASAGIDTAIAALKAVDVAPEFPPPSA